MEDDVQPPSTFVNITSTTAVYERFTIMYGKIFESMFTGSLAGQGALSFAVWAYVIAHQRPDKDGVMWVELNALVVGSLLGEETPDVEGVIKAFCEPDPLSRSQEEGGKRLVRDGTFLYRVVNGAKYRQMRQEEDRREYQKVYQRERRKAIKEAPAREKAVQKLMRPGGARTMEERLREKAEKEGDAKTIAALDRMSPHQRQAKATSDEFVERFHKSMEAANAALAAASPAAVLEPGKESISGDGTVAAEGAEGEKFPEV